MIARTAILFCLLLYVQEPPPIEAGFAETDLTPDLGARKIGWNNKNFGTTVLDPLFVRAAVFTSGEGRAAFLGLDLLFVHRDQVAEIRRRIQAAYGFPGSAVMIGATHNHAGPAIEDDLYPKDEAYVQRMIEKAVAAFGQAWESRQKAEVGYGSTPEWRVGYNRRVIYRDGTVRTHGTFKDPNALALEGPVDPEVGVLAARSASGRLLGAVVNFACHPCHHGGDQAFTAGYPGQLAKALKEKGCPITLFLQGAAGNLHHADPSGVNKEKTMEEAGAALAEDVEKVLGALKYRPSARISSRSRDLELPYRAVTEQEVRGKVRGAQRFGEPGFYDKTADRVLEEIRRTRTARAEIQAIWIDDLVHVSIPAEYFVQGGLRIKEATRPQHTRVVAYANGMVGYVPHREAFTRGGYETTFGLRSKLAPEALDLLADGAIGLVLGK